MMNFTTPSLVRNYLKLNSTAAIFTLSLLVLVCQSNAQGLTVVKNDKYKIKTASGKHSTVQLSFNGLNNFDIEYRGKFQLNDTDTEIVSISPGGYLEISKTTFGSKREIILESEAGILKKTYYEGRRKVDFDPEGRRWLAEILPDIVRSTGLAAESRIDRYLKKGGVPAVMDEIDRLESNHIQSIYGKVLLNKKGLEDEQLAEAIVELIKEMDSDHYKADLLNEVADTFLRNETLASAYFEAATYIDSDYHSASILSGALKDVEPSESIFEGIMEACENIGSDYYHASVLTDALQMRNLNDEVVSSLINSSKNVGSDYYQSQVLKEAMKVSGLSDKSYRELMSAIGDVSSDYYTAEVFEKMIDREVDESIIEAMIETADNQMSSDYYKAAIFSKMVRNQTISPEAMSKLSEAISNMSSSSHAADVIKEAAEIRNIEKAVLISLIHASGDIDSDYYCSEALESLSWHVRDGDGDIKDAYRQAAKNIDSNHYYGRVIKALE